MQSDCEIIAATISPPHTLDKAAMRATMEARNYTEPLRMVAASRSALAGLRRHRPAPQACWDVWHQCAPVTPAADHDPTMLEPLARSTGQVDWPNRLAKSTGPY